MERYMPKSVKEEQELVPGGDIRINGNMWLRTTFDSARLRRVPREGEVRRVIQQIATLYDLCTLALD